MFFIYRNPGNRDESPMEDLCISLNWRQTQILQTKKYEGRGLQLYTNLFPTVPVQTTLNFQRGCSENH